MKSTRRRIHLNMAIVASMVASLIPTLAAPAIALSTDIVVSQVYGGGGNSGATLTNDYVELFNRGTTAVSVTGWSVQYASSTGTTWSKTDLSGTIQPGQYYLVQQAAGTGGTTPLPAPDAVGTIAMSATNGKIVLVNTGGVIASGTTCPSDSTVVDIVGYGSANCSEGAATPVLSNTTAAIRLNGGCTENDSNSTDFAVDAPTPRNSSSPTAPCGGPTDPSGVGSASPDLVEPGETTLLAVDVTPGTNPTSTGLAVVADLSAIGESSTQAFFDDGSNGDVTAGDNRFSFLATVALATAEGAKSLPVVISDAQSRSGDSSIDLTVQSVTAGAEVVISEVYGGGGNSGATLTHDYVELYNRSSSPVDITGWSVQYASSTGTTWSKTDLSGTVQPGQYFLIQQAQGSGGTTPLPTPDAIGTIAMSATNGKIVLINTSIVIAAGTSCPSDATVVDIVGYGSANCFEGSGATGTLSNTTSAIRNGAGSVDTNNNTADFTVGAPDPQNGGAGFDVAPTVASTTPANGAVSVAVGASVSVVFSEAVNLVDPWFSISCDTSGVHSAVVSGGPTSFTLDPDTDFAASETCMLSIFSSGVTDQDGNDPPDSMESDVIVTFSIGSANPCEDHYTAIPAIQGSGATAAITGAVTTLGVVVGDYEGPSPTLRGFYIQDPAGDGDPATSDAIFVFNGDNNNVALGELVRVSGAAGEFEGQTQVGSVSSIVSCGFGSVIPVDVSLPVPVADHFERYEGMVVRFAQTLYVTEHFQLGRFGQVVMSSGARLSQPTNVTTPGAAALALQAANNLNRIIVDDDSQIQNPDPIVFGRSGNPLSASNTLRGGDSASGIIGVMTYTWAGNSASGNAYRVRPNTALGGGIPNFVATNPRPVGPETVGGSLTVSALNLLNYFNTFDGLPDTVDNCNNGVGGASTDCRGADTQAEFDRQWAKTVAAILAIDPDVLGVNEIENDGYGPTSAIAHLVDQLNASTAPGTYAFVDFDSATGQINALGTDAIKVGLIYKPASVSPVGAAAALNSDAFVNGGDSAPRNRATFAQALEQPNGARFIVSVNHLKSKGSACNLPDAGDGQGNCNQVRVNASNELASWLAADPTGTGDPDVMILGDLNSYAMEDPLTALGANGYINLISTFLGPDAYSFAFDGQWGYLDHALASASLLAQVSGVTEWHINADEPGVLDYNLDFKSVGQQASLYAADQYRVSDHDPVIVGVDLAGPPVVQPPVTDPEPSVLNGAVQVTASFTDGVGPFSCVVDFGDATFVAGTVAGNDCNGPAHAFAAIGTVTVTVTVSDSAGLSGQGSSQHVVIYDFTGFFGPVQNPPVLNVMNGGSTSQIRFGLGGDQGLGVFASGSPRSRQVNCSTLVGTGSWVAAQSPGSSGLMYDAQTSSYQWNWKTEKPWRGTCRVFELALIDGTVHLAYFKFS